MTKTELRDALNADLAAFTAAGKTVTVCAPSRRKSRNTASGKQKLRLGWSEPKNRPSNAWDLVEMV